ncbi:MAG: MCE family protein [Proteobacteria bacterium]|nr:MCE family protein [Pseudomonadota bacterium]
MVLKFRTMEKVVGTFVISVFILLLSMVVLVGRGKDWFRKNVMYTTTFGESYDLDLNSSVKLFNADIGKVKKVNLVGNRVEVSMAIYEEFANRIRTDSTASVEGISYIGKKYISIKPGSEKAPLLEEEGNIPSVENKSIGDILKEFEIEKTAKMVIRAVQDLADITALIKDPEGPLFTALASINHSLAQVEERIGKIMDNVVLTTSKVPGAVDQARTDLEKIHEIGEELLANIAELKKILANVEKGSQDVPPVTRSLKSGIGEIRSAVENVDDVVQALQKNVLIRSHIPAEPQGEAVDAGLR